MNVVAHNLVSMNAQRQLNINTKSRAKSTERLSSGYRINRAADDAAGLAISEKMRRQIRGLTQGVSNTQDGVSLCQVADGALSEVSDMLHRITELSVKAANGTNTDSDRDAIQQEIGQILQEIDRVSDTTTFNDKKIFTDGTETESTEINGIDSRILATGIKENSFSIRYNGANTVTFDDSHYRAGNRIEGTYLTFGETGTRPDSPITTYDMAVLDNFSIILPQDNPSRYASELSRVISDKRTSNSLSLRDIKIDDEGFLYYDSKVANQRMYLVEQDDYYNNGAKNLAANYTKDYPRANYIIVPTTSDTDVEENQGIWIQSGSEAGVGMYLKIDPMNTAILGIDRLDVSTFSGANRAMESTKGSFAEII